MMGSENWWWRGEILVVIAEDSIETSFNQSIIVAINIDQWKSSQQNRWNCLFQFWDLCNFKFASDRQGQLIDCSWHSSKKEWKCLCCIKLEVSSRWYFLSQTVTIQKQTKFRISMAMFKRLGSMVVQRRSAPLQVCLQNIYLSATSMQ